MSDSPLVLALYSKTPGQHFSRVLGRAIGYSLLLQEEGKRMADFEEIKRLLTELGSDSLSRVETIYKLVSLMGFNFDIRKMNLTETEMMKLFWDAKLTLESFWESDIAILIDKFPEGQKKQLLVRAFQDELSLIDSYREMMGYSNVEGANLLPEGQIQITPERNLPHGGNKEQ
jgi:hypothetical protein